jgi:hypothetical protein
MKMSRETNSKKASVGCPPFFKKKGAAYMTLQS